jgi:hypothetical protein
VHIVCPIITERRGNEVLPTSIISDVLASKTGFWGH